MSHGDTCGISKKKNLGRTGRDGKLINQVSVNYFNNRTNEYRR